MPQRIRLNPNGVAVPTMMQPYHTNQAKQTPAIKLKRLQELLKTHAPKICVVRGEGIGDVLMTTPTIHALKELFQDTEIHYATNTGYLNGALVKVLQYNPDIAEILDRNLIDDNQYDLIINMHCPCIHYEKTGNPPINRIDIFASHVGIKLNDPYPRYYIQQSEIEEGFARTRSYLHKKIVVLQPYASTERRTLEMSKWRDVAYKLATECNTINLVLKHDSDFHDNIEWNSIPNTTILRDLDIRQIAGLIYHCNLVVCPDSSILHLAGAMKVPTVSLFGPTHPAARINYYHNTVALWKVNGVPSCCCWYDSGCKLGNRCWKIMQPDEIIELCKKQLSISTRNQVTEYNQSRLATIKTEII